MTREAHRVAITPVEWSTGKQDRLLVRGPRTMTVAGQHTIISLDLAAMPPEERYSLARTWGRWCERVEQQALADIEAEAQAPLF